MLLRISIFAAILAIFIAAFLNHTFVWFLCGAAMTVLVMVAIGILLAFVWNIIDGIAGLIEMLWEDFQAKRAINKIVKERNKRLNEE